MKNIYYRLLNEAKLVSIKLVERSEASHKNRISKYLDAELRFATLSQFDRNTTNWQLNLHEFSFAKLFFR